MSEPDPITRPWLPKVLARVDEIAALPDNWDSYHGTAPTPAAAATTRALVHALSAWHIVAPKHAPQVVPSADGGIEIVWREQGYNLDIDIEPDGRITGWLQRLDDKAEITWGYDEEAE